MKNRTILILVQLFLISACPCNVTLPLIFSDGMILQQGVRVPVWGWAEPGEEISVSFRGQKKSVFASDAGKWMVQLDPLKTSGRSSKMVIRSNNKITLEDVLVGEVWLASGQSNMQFTLRQLSEQKGSPTPVAAEITGADNPLIRQFRVGRKYSPDRELDSLEGSWKACTPENIMEFSGTAYFFARDLNEKLDVPVGIISNAIGGSTIEAWVRREVLESNWYDREIIEDWKITFASADVEGELQTYKQKKTAWEKERKEAQRNGIEPPSAPERSKVVFMETHRHHEPSALFNGMVSPIVPYALKGVIFYQGESNAASGATSVPPRFENYHLTFQNMIRDWREQWGQGEFPFYYVQLANFKAPSPDHQENGWSNIREAQRQALSLKNTGMAISIDIGEEKDIHPRNKIELGRRLATIALVRDYGMEDLVYSGPMIRNAEFREGTVLLTFEHAGSGLIVAEKNDVWSDPLPADSPLRGFHVRGPGGRWHQAEAEITGISTVEVSNPDVTDPVEVSYAWAMNPETSNLYNREGLPASPFRQITDHVIADFSSSEWPSGWKIEGTAFGSPLPDKSSRLYNKPTPNHKQYQKGKMVSPPFKVYRDYINVELKGVSNPGKCYVALYEGDRELRRATPGPGRSPWTSFDVKDLKGSEVTLVISDRHFNGWLDPGLIFQSEIPVSAHHISDVPAWEETTFEAVIDKKYLLIPVNQGDSPLQEVTIEIGGKKLLTFDTPLSLKGSDNMLPVYDLSAYQGEILRFHYHETGNSAISENILLSDEMPERETGPDKPAFHIHTRFGSLNDPNGLVYYDGEYHLLHQYGMWRGKHWYHYVSTDLFHWKELPVGLFPDHLGSMHSGSGAVDWFNTGGFQTGEDKVIIAAFTGSKGFGGTDKRQVQGIAYSNDRARTYTKYEGNPVIGEERCQPPDFHNRDPKIFWYSPTRGMDYKAEDGHWVMALFEGKVSLFTSKDLKNWKHTQSLELNRWFECPEFFEMAVDGDPGNRKWILCNGHGDYYIGDFDGEIFTPDDGKEIQFAHANHYYAAQTFNNTAGMPPRRVQMAWQHHQISIPVELNLRTTEEGLRLFVLPVKEIENIYAKSHRMDGLTIGEGDENALAGFDSGLYDIDMEFSTGTADSVEFIIRGIRYTYDVAAGLFYTDMFDPYSKMKRYSVNAEPVNGRVRLRFVVDNMNINTYIQDGRHFMPLYFKPHFEMMEGRGLSINAIGGEIEMSRLRIQELSGIF